MARLYSTILLDFGEHEFIARTLDTPLLVKSTFIGNSFVIGKEVVSHTIFIPTFQSLVGTFWNARIVI